MKKIVDYALPSTPVMNSLDFNRPSVSYYQRELNRENNNNAQKIPEVNSITETNNLNTNDDIKPRIVNIVSTVSLEYPLNLRNLALKLNNAEYNPKRINALIIRMKKPKTAALVFSNGKMVVVGAQDELDSRNAAKKYAHDIKNLGYASVKFKNFKIENVVGSCGVGFKIRLTKLSLKLKLMNNKACSYEPDLFPGLIYHMQEPKICLLIFESGKIVFVGAKEKQQIYDGLNKVINLLKQYKKDDKNPDSSVTRDNTLV